MPDHLIQRLVLAKIALLIREHELANIVKGKRSFRSAALQQQRRNPTEELHHFTQRALSASGYLRNGLICETGVDGDNLAARFKTDDLKRAIERDCKNHRLPWLPRDKATLICADVPWQHCLHCTISGIDRGGPLKRQLIVMRADPNLRRRIGDGN